MRPPASTLSLTPYAAGRRLLAARSASRVRWLLNIASDTTEECSHTLCGHRRKCAVELGGTSGLQELKLHSQRPSRDGHFSDRELVVRIGRVREDGHTADLADGLL